MRLWLCAFVSLAACATTPMQGTPVTALNDLSGYWSLDQVNGRDHNAQIDGRAGWIQFSESGLKVYSGCNTRAFNGYIDPEGSLRRFDEPFMETLVRVGCRDSATGRDVVKARDEDRIFALLSEGAEFFQMRDGTLAVKNGASTLVASRPDKGFERFTGRWRIESYDGWPLADGGLNNAFVKFWRGGFEISAGCNSGGFSGFVDFQGQLRGQSVPSTLMGCQQIVPGRGVSLNAFEVHVFGLAIDGSRLEPIGENQLALQTDAHRIVLVRTP